ncbi:MAG TPA: WecB/TagA/CpsF family glycosyltransferase [Terriglobales bacterium]|nr:WecB/TagA/CpsF family glycosyltransferase [Terriglobales bacterium]
MTPPLRATPDSSQIGHTEPPPSFPILGVAVHAVQIPGVVSQIQHWIRSDLKGRYIAVTSMHGIAESRTDSDYRCALDAADLVVPDGMPLVWFGRWHGHLLKRRVYGPELMETFCRETGSTYRHFFYGGGPGTAERLADSLRQRYGIVVAGTYTPPFRPLTDEEHKDLSSLIDEVSPNVLWVGLSTPKQEKWIHQNRHKFPVNVMIGVGAAFDFNSGKTLQAPVWMREHGLEWLFRLSTEPRRLWRRYLVSIPKAAGLVFLELVGLLPRSLKRPLVTDNS